MYVNMRQRRPFKQASATPSFYPVQIHPPFCILTVLPLPPSVQEVWRQFCHPSFNSYFWLNPNPMHGPGPCLERLVPSRAGTRPNLGQWGLYWGVICIDILVPRTAGSHLAIKRELAQEWGWQDRQQRWEMGEGLWALLSVGLFIIVRGRIM